MANITVTQLRTNNPIDVLTGNEPIETVQSGTSGATTVQDIANLADAPITVKVSLTSAQILDLANTPISIVAAQGANTIIVPISGVLKYNYVTTQYSTLGTVNFGYSASATAMFTYANLLTTATANRVYLTVPTSATLSGNTAINQAVNQPFVAYMGVNPTVGDGTIDFYLTYKVITLS